MTTNTMRHVNITITGPEQSGKTTVATKIEDSLRALGFMTTRTENGERIPTHRQRLYNRHEWPTEEPCRVVINESWATRMLKATCDACGYTIRLSKKWAIEVGAECPRHGTMEIEGIANLDDA